MTTSITATSDGLSGELGVNGNPKMRFGADTSGQLVSFRNKLINGGGALSQRGLSTAVVAGGVYGADRWITYISGGTGITAITGADTSGLATTSKGYIYLSGTWTNGAPGFAQRIESVNSFGLNSKKVTVSGKIYHNLGSNQNFQVKLVKPTVSDNFTSTTQIGVTTVVGSVSTATVTPFQATFTLGSSDASNGLQVNVETSSSISATSKLVAITDVQLEEGSIATPTEQRPIGVEASLCYRYYWTCGSAYTVWAFSSVKHASSSYWRESFALPVPMRTVPTMLLRSTVDGTANMVVVDGVNKAATASGVNNGVYQVAMSNVLTTTDQFINGNVAASAEI